MLSNNHSICCWKQSQRKIFKHCGFTSVYILYCSILNTLWAAMTAAIRAGKSRVTSSSCLIPIVVALLFVAVLSISFIYEFHQPSAGGNFLSQKLVLNPSTADKENLKKPVVSKVILQHHVSKGTSEFLDAVTSPLQPFSKKQGAFDMHFIHIPKCGGTSMTAILRDVACTIDQGRNNDCCTNPGQ